MTPSHTILTHPVSTRAARLLAASLAALAAALLACALTASSASALSSIPFQGSFCEPTGIATAPCEPAFNKPTGLAVDPATGDLLVIDAGVNEVQSLTVSATAGTFRLSFRGQTTADIPYNATAPEVRSALRALSTIGSPNVNVSGTAPYAISFTKALAFKDLPQITAADGTVPLSGGSGASLETTTPGAFNSLSRWHPDGTPSDFAALGTNVVDGALGPEEKPCGEEAASCDATPANAGVLGWKGGTEEAASSPAESREVQVAIAPPGAAAGTAGDIYLTNHAGHLIDVFAADGHHLGQIAKSGGANLEGGCGVAVDAGGTLYVGDEHEVHKYLPSANPPLNTDSVADFPIGGSCALAAGAGPSAGSIFVVHHDFGTVTKYDASSGAFGYLIIDSEEAGNFGKPKTVGLNPANGNLLVAWGGGIFSKASEFDVTGPTEATEVAIATPSSRPEGLAYDPATAHLYVTRFGSTQVEVFGEPVDLAQAATGAAEPIGQTTATLTGTVDPTGSLLSSCGFSYLSEAAYQANLTAEADPFAGASSEACAETPAAIGEGEEPVAVHADIAGLTEGVRYRYRLSATNLGGTVHGATKAFATRSPPQIAETWLADATYSGATVRAKVNPGFYATTIQVAYGPTDSYGEQSAALSAGTADGTLRTVTAELTGLEPGTAYHFKLIASNENGSAESADATLTTYREAGTDDCPNAALRVGPGAALPDCRGYEMVSPLDKNGGDIVAAESPAGIGTSGFYQAAVEGGKITYTSATAFGDAVRGAFANQYLATRGSSGWSSRTLNPLQGETVFDAAGTPLAERAYLDLGTGFQAFTPDLCHSLLVDQNQTPLDPAAIHGYTNLYWRDNCGSAADSYEAITTGAAPLSTSHNDAPLYLVGRNFTPDRDRVFFSTSAQLTADAAPAGEGARKQIYGWQREAGAPRLVSVLPTQTANPNGAAVGSGIPLQRHQSSLARALSVDGSRLYWTAEATTTGPYGPRPSLYLRRNPFAPASSLAHGSATGNADLTAGSDQATAALAATGSFAPGQTVTSAGQLIPGDGIASALGRGTLTASSPTITAARLLAGSFLAGERISAEGIPDGAEIEAVELEGEIEEQGETIKLYRITLSAPADASGADVVLTAKTTIEAVEGSTLTLSAPATKTEGSVALDAYSACTEPQAACTLPIYEALAPKGGKFLSADRDGSTAVFSVDAGGERDVSDGYLLEYDAETGVKRWIAGHAALAGASNDLSYLYFTSKEALAAGASEGEWNLYLRHDDDVSFIAVLSQKDRGVGADGGGFVDALNPQNRGTRVSPDGRQIAFMTVVPQGGYDNRDQASGEAVSEVYRYDADTEKLACVSCNPSGARPAAQQRAEGIRVAAWLPGWEWSNYGSRTLSDDGSRVFFNAYDALVPADTNGAADVYEWEAPGAGSCSSDSPDYSPQNEGCLSLLSTGRGSEGSRFLDASADGGDIFFRTSSSISPADPGLIDIYDARVGGGEAPPPPSAPPCEGDACQSVPPAPAEPRLSFEGPGNVKPAARKRRCPKGKRRVRRKGRARCVKRRHRANKHHRKHRRRHAKRGRGRR